MDKDTTDKCAFNLVGAWWFHNGACAYSILTGLYLFGPTNEGWGCLLWYYWKSHSYSLKFAEMKIRPYHIWTSRHLVFASVTDMRTLTWCNWNNKTIMIAACEELLLICLTTTNICQLIVHGVSKKYIPCSLIITLAMWTDFQIFFTSWLVVKFSRVYTLHIFPAHLQYVATQSCESGKSKDVAEQNQHP